MLGFNSPLTIRLWRWDLRLLSHPKRGAVYENYTVKGYINKSVYLDDSATFYDLS